MGVINENSNAELNSLNEMAIKVMDGLDKNTEHSIYYARLKAYLLKEIVLFAREKVELKEDLLALRDRIGDLMNEEEIRGMLDSLKEKYNNKPETNIGLDYHIECTRIDYGVSVFVVIKRDDCYMKKFVFRFKKGSVSEYLSGLTPGQTIIAGYNKSEDK